MAIRAGDILFVDTCVLLTATVETRRHHYEACRLFTAAERCGAHIAMSGQIIREYLVVATRPGNVNGFGLSPDEALGNVAEFQRRSVFYDEAETVANRLVRLVRTYQLAGKRIHDANVVATMLTYGLTKLVTENTGDFSVFPELEILDSAAAVNAMSGTP